jgi:hypothetical protein
MVAMMDDILFRAAPILLIAVPAFVAVATVAALEVVYGKWRYTVRGLLLAMTFIAIAIAYHAARK